ncbi:hypothetical protein V1281_002490 [Nitrobacteraceae bacterium AZCC 2161]
MLNRLVQQSFTGNDNAVMRFHHRPTMDWAESLVFQLVAGPRVHDVCIGKSNKIQISQRDLQPAHDQT